jgi:hypothetical protein
MKEVTSITMFSYLAYFSALKMEATCLSVTLVDFQRAAKYYIPELRMV